MVLILLIIFIERVIGLYIYPYVFLIHELLARDGDALEVSVRATPKGGRRRAGRHDGALGWGARCSRSACGGPGGRAATAAVIKVLAAAAGNRPLRVRLTSGATARLKVFRLAGIPQPCASPSPRPWSRRLARAEAGGGAPSRGRRPMLRPHELLAHGREHVHQHPRLDADGAVVDAPPAHRSCRPPSAARSCRRWYVEHPALDAGDLHMGMAVRHAAGPGCLSAPAPS